MSTVLQTADEVSANGDRTAFNKAVWAKLLDDPVLAALDYRIETDEHGQIIMSPPPAPSHGSKQSEISRFLGNWNPSGKVVSECPISTSKGVKAADVAWCSAEIWAEAKNDVCFVRCPEICVEVISPCNTKSEIAEKKQLYFESGAREVWICAKSGSMQFYLREDPEVAHATSSLCEGFPPHIE